MIDAGKLIREALKAREMSYSPYSGYCVGAALLTANGQIYTGCNIENAAFSPTNCAERTAFFKAVSEGQRDFCAIAIVGSKKGPVEHFAWPCGVCRQVMAEFCDPDRFAVITAVSEEKFERRLLKELLPASFGPGHVTE